MPQCFLLSLVIYIFYLAEFLNQDPELWFGYTNDLYLYKATRTLELNIKLLANNIQKILDDRNKNKNFFTLEKVEIIYFSRKYKSESLPVIINENLIIYPITTNEREG
jgi:hypothetical protein